MAMALSLAAGLRMTTCARNKNNVVYINAPRVAKTAFSLFFFFSFSRLSREILPIRERFEDSSLKITKATIIFANLFST